jgi:type IV secretion system protein TrbL
MTAAAANRHVSILARLIIDAAVLVVGLFVVQVITAAIRREPGGLGRALTGAALALGSLLVRQALIVIAAVLAPLALAGGTARLTMDP